MCQGVESGKIHAPDEDGVELISIHEAADAYGAIMGGQARKYVIRFE